MGTILTRRWPLAALAAACAAASVSAQNDRSDRNELYLGASAGYVSASPYAVRVDGRRATLYRDDVAVGPVTLPPRPRIYDMATADGVPYWKIALLHLDSIASTVVQKCIYWGTHEQCGFCGIELTRGDAPGMTRWRKRLFVAISHITTDAAEYFRLPRERTVIMGSRIEV